jgi:hypothetical protein
VKVVLGIAALALALAGCSPNDEETPQAEGVVLGPPSFQNLDPHVTYTGMNACRSCHLGVHSTYVESGMARSLAIPPISEPDAKSWTVGSGRHLTASFVERAGAIERPICMQSVQVEVDLAEWVQVPCVEDGLDQRHVTGGADPRACLDCHDVADPIRVTAPRGVDCERCHGPGELHVARWKNSSERGTGSPDPTIVNPRRLPPSGRMAVCLQCHLGDPQETARIVRDGRSAKQFRPGMPFDAIWSAWRLSHGSPNEFGAASQGDRLLRSRCYLESNGRMDCTTCHNPHVSVYREDRPPDLFRVQCLGCHAVEDCRTPARARGSTTPADDCVACHMRRAEPVDQRGTQYTDHWIRANPAAEIEKAACAVEPVLEPAEPDPEEEAYRARALAELCTASRNPG